MFTCKCKKEIDTDIETVYGCFYCKNDFCEDCIGEHEARCEKKTSQVFDPDVANKFGQENNAHVAEPFRSICNNVFLYGNN